MKKIIAINSSPRVNWNTASLVREAAKGVESAGADVTAYDLYRLDPFRGCVSCMGCKLPGCDGTCVVRDSLHPLLRDIAESDGLIIGTPNYLGNISSGFRTLYERLIYPRVSYSDKEADYSGRKIPVLLIMTSNCHEDEYSKYGYDKMLFAYQETFRKRIGSTKTLIYGNSLQVSDYSKFDWTMFDIDSKKYRHEHMLPLYKHMAYELGVEMVLSPWQK